LSISGTSLSYRYRLALTRASVTWASENRRTINAGSITKVVGVDEARVQWPGDLDDNGRHVVGFDQLDLETVAVRGYRSGCERGYVGQLRSQDLGPELVLPTPLGAAYLVVRVTLMEAESARQPRNSRCVTR
jgi:hypothetical protein